MHKCWSDARPDVVATDIGHYVLLYLTKPTVFTQSLINPNA